MITTAEELKPSGGGKALGADPRGASRWEWLVRVLLVILPVVVFGPILEFEFVEWDDDVNILLNPHVAGLGWEELKWMFTDVERAHRYLPLGWLCFALERSLWGADPRVFHLGNLVLHVVNGLLLYSIVKRGLGVRMGWATEELRLPVVAGLGVLVWSLNPLRVEVVSWCSARIYLMSTFWFFLAVWLYLDGVAAAGGKRRRLPWAWGCFLLSLLTYPAMLLGGVVFPMLECLVTRRLSMCPWEWFRAGQRKVGWVQVPFVMLSVCWVGLMVATRNVGLEYSYAQTLEVFGVWQRLMQGFYGWVYFLWKPWWPTGLAPQYGSLSGFSPWEARFVVSAVLVVGLTVVAVWRWRQWPALVGWWVGHLILYLPFLGLTEYPHSLYDRYSYAVGAWWAVGVVVALWLAWPHYQVRMALMVLVGLVVAGFAWGSSTQSLVWQNTATVRLRVAQSLGDREVSAQHWDRAGEYYLTKEQGEPALVCFQRATKLKPADVDMRVHLGEALGALGRAQEAHAVLRAAAGDPSADAATRLNVGVAFCRLGQFEEGITIFRRLVEENPGYENARHNLSLALERVGRSEENHRVQRTSGGLEGP